MYNIEQITAFLEKNAPLSYQESYDNAGLITGSPKQAVTGVLIALDSTEAVVQEAKTLNCNLIIAHHPIVFSGLKKITGRNYIERTVIEAIRAHIGIYAIHTNLDNILTGVNQKICAQIGIQNPNFIVSKMAKDQNKIGAGLIGDLEKPLQPEDFLKHLKEKMDLEVIKYTPISKKISKVAVCGGAGSFLLDDAKKAGADAFVTSDFKYHQFFDAEDELMIADIGHYESEKFTMDLLENWLTMAFPNLIIRKTNVYTNPVRYY